MVSFRQVEEIKFLKISLIAIDWNNKFDKNINSVYNLVTKEMIICVKSVTALFVPTLARIVLSVTGTALSAMKNPRFTFS